MATPSSIRQQFADTMLAVGQEDEKLVGMAAGMARSGLRVVTHTIAPFLIERSFEQIKLDFAYHKLPGNIITVGSAFDYANLGCTHHCYGDFALLKTLPGVEIVFAASAVEFDMLFRQAYANPQLTVYRVAGTSHGVSFERVQIVLGRAVKVADGNDITLIATGPHLSTALAVKEALAAAGQSADVLYIHTIRPLDTEAVLASVAKTHKVVVIEEHMRSGGLGDDVLRCCYRVPELRFVSASIPDTFVTGYGSYEGLCRSVGLTPDAILASIAAEFGINA